MTTGSDWMPYDDISYDEISEEINERRHLAWLVLILLFGGLIAAVLNVVAILIG